uniref:hypothetical protein n=1 Tax=Eubacterium sp. TaxID=142586 RepID=UPI0040253970
LQQLFLDVNKKLKVAYTEKSEINAKLQKTYKEKSERGAEIKLLNSKLKKAKTDNDKLTKELKPYKKYEILSFYGIMKRLKRLFKRKH